MRLARIEHNRRRLRLMMVGICQSPIERARGLLLRRWGRGTALLLQPCNAIHTWGMARPLDLVFCDTEGRVVELVQGLPPWRFARCATAHCVWEFHAGAIGALGVQRGDLIRPC